ncbi:uncharacterized protein LOC128349312 isoform X2 [Hemicordylus capensis]|nr:uncharacterized protein LOC128349312 isoform X2 [Hemicordylus capensis]
MKALNVELGLIIDLTYTTRYYDVKDVPKSVEYKKLYTVGLQVPDDPTILQFKKWVRKFLWENAENEKLIGVHCTNGINRTGYLICRYLIDVEGWHPETAIQAFEEARGHHMDSLIYLTDLTTQPMRSNMGMNMWDDDEDIMPPPNDMDGHIDRFPNEEFPRPGKRLRVYQDDQPHGDLPGQIQLREFDFINKGPGQRRKPYHDQLQDDLQQLLRMRQRHFPDDQYYDDYQEEMHLKDLEFASSGSGQRLRPFRDQQFCDDFLGSTPSGDLVNTGHGQRQRHFPDITPHSDTLTDMHLNKGRGERRRAFYDPQSNDEFRSPKQLKDVSFFNKGSGQRIRNFHDYPLHDDMQPPVGDFEFVSRGRGQRMIPFFNQQHHNDLPREMPPEDFDDRDSGSRSRPFHDHQSYNDFSEQTQFKDFLKRGPEQRMRHFSDHSPNDNLPHEEYLERGQPFPSHKHFPEHPLPHRDYVSDKDDYSINCRPDCPEDYKRSHPSDEINRGGKIRFAPYPAQPVHHPSSKYQKVSSISVDYGRETQHGITREMGQGTRLPVVTIDYNYGLPLDYASEEEDRACYDLLPRERYVWK